MSQPRKNQRNHIRKIISLCRTTNERILRKGRIKALKDLSSNDQPWNGEIKLVHDLKGSNTNDQAKKKTSVENRELSRPTNEGTAENLNLPGFRFFFFIFKNIV